MRPVPRLLRAGLAHLRVEAEVADQLAGCLEAADFADRRDQRAGSNAADPRQGHQAAHLLAGEHLERDRLLEPADLLGEEVDLAQAARDRLLLVVGQVLPGEPAAAGDTEEVAHRRPLLQVADQRCVHLILRPCALPHQLRPPRDQPPAATGPFVRQPHLRQQTTSEQPGQRARVDLVRLQRARRAGTYRLRVGEQDTADMRLDDTSDRERVAGRHKRDLVVHRQTAGEERERLRSRLHPARRADGTSLGDRDLAEVAVDVKPDEAHVVLLSLEGRRDRGGRRRHLRIRAHGTPGQSQGGQLQTAGSQPIEEDTGLPNLESHGALPSGKRNRRYARSRMTPTRGIASSCPYNEERLHEELGDLPPVEYEELNIKTDNTPILSAR